jgi:phosphoserine phosphatase RsbU/P
VAVLLLLLVLPGLAVVDVRTGDRFVLVGLFAVVPLVAAALCPPRVTSALAVAAVAAAAVAGALYERLDSVDHVVRLAVLSAVGVAAVVLSYLRCQREHDLRVMTDVAVVAQRALLRSFPSAIGRVGVAVRYQSAAEEALVGGDLYDAVLSPGGVRILIGDVRGKGLEAVHLASVVLGAFRTVAPGDDDLADVAEMLDLAVSREAGEEDFVTALLVEVHDDDTLTLVNCGHHPPALITPSGLEFLTANTLSPPLGLRAEPRLELHRWRPADRLLLYTDGLVEARDISGDFFFLEGQVECLFRDSLEHCLDELVQAVTSHARDGLQDDLAVVLLANLPPPQHLSVAGPGAAAATARKAAGRSRGVVARRHHYRAHVPAHGVVLDGVQPLNLRVSDADA